MFDLEGKTGPDISGSKNARVVRRTGVEHGILSSPLRLQRPALDHMKNSNVPFKLYLEADRSFCLGEDIAMHAT